MFFKIRSRGNIGNRMMQYISANEIAKNYPDSHLFNVNIEEYNIIKDDIDETNYRTLLINDDFQSKQEVINRIDRENPELVVFDGFLQKQFLMEEPGPYREMFSLVQPVEISEQDLVINIRCGELIYGLSQYPLIPIAFYKKIIEETKLNPVFMGQLDNTRYCQMLRKNFPDARFLPHISPQADFDFIRSAHHIVLGISTFSFMAAWLSNAKTIHTPLWGFFSVPSFLREIDLLPTKDERFRYYVLPYTYALVEGRQIAFNEGVEDYIEAISSSDVEAIKNRFASGKTVPRQFHVDDFWYLATNLDCGYQMAKGLCHDPYDHYMTTGLWEGRSPAPHGKGRYRNVSHDKKAMISSYTDYAGGNTAAEQAQDVINGSRVDRMAFHTKEELNPFVIVDLLSLHKIDHISIFNRCENDVVSQRCLPLHIYCGDSGDEWSLLHIQNERFGGSDGKPLEVELCPDVQCRFIKMTTPQTTFLHFEKIHIYGKAVVSPTQTAVSTADGTY